MGSRVRPTSVGLAAQTALVVVFAAGLSACHGKTEAPPAPTTAAPTATHVELTQSQLAAIKVLQVGDHAFSPQRTAVGSIDFDEDRSVQVFSNYQGKIVQAFAQVGDEVEKGQPLYTIESPDLMTAASTLLSAQGVEDMNLKAMERASKLHETKGISDQNLEAAVSAEITSDAALKAARAAVMVFGKSEAEINQMIAKRRVDPILVVRSPIAGRVTARNAQPGLLVQPGNAPAPYSVADLSTMWMLANVPEADAPLFRRGQPVKVKVMAFPDRVFDGQVSVVGATVDPTTHTALVRSEISDPDHELKPGMFADFVIGVSAPLNAPTVPQDSVVREGDGSMNVWVTTDRRHFDRRTVKIGLQQDGFDQVIAGLNPGELVVGSGAVFLSNMANAADAGE